MYSVHVAKTSSLLYLSETYDYKLEIYSFYPVLYYLKVLVVGGGYYGRYNEISSTEIFTMESKTWSVSAPLSLPVPRGFASVSLNNKVYFLGKLFFIFAKLSLNSISTQTKAEASLISS